MQNEAQAWFQAAKLIRPFTAITGAFLNAGATAIITTFISSPGREGVVQGFNFYGEPEDYQTNPWSLVEFGTQQYEALAMTVPNPTLGDPVPDSGSPYFVPPSRDRGTPFMFPFGGYWFDQNKSLGLQVKNNEASPFYFEGLLVGITWNISDRDTVYPIVKNVLQDPNARRY